MKKTLFAMLTLALMGGQAFGADYYTSQFAGKMFGQSGSGVTGKYKYSVNGDATIIVDSSVATGSGSPYYQSFNGKTTVAFNGTDSWSIKCVQVEFTNSVNITSTAEVAQSWIDIFADTPGAQITLITGTSFSLPSSLVLLEGVAKNGKITLQGTTDTVEFTYLGLVNLDMNPSFTLNDGEIAIGRVLDSNSQTQYFLTGALPKSSPTTPEPATATLSLLALAGLATRRKRK